MNISYAGLILLVCFVAFKGHIVNRLETRGLRGASFRLALQTALDVTVMVMGEKYIWVGAEIWGLIISNVAPSYQEKRVQAILHPALIPFYKAGSILISGMIWGLFQYIR